jgi:predicted RNA-binding protein Jag
VALGIETPVEVEQTADGPRLNLTGEQAELLARHRGEPIKALQHIVDMAFGRDLDDGRRVFVDALGYRKGKDIELREMAKFLAAGRRRPALNSSSGR